MQAWRAMPAGRTACMHVHPCQLSNGCACCRGPQARAAGRAGAHHGSGGLPQRNWRHHARERCAPGRRVCVGVLAGCSAAVHNTHRCSALLCMVPVAGPTSAGATACGLAAPPTVTWTPCCAGNLNLSRAIGDLRYKMNNEVRGEGELMHPPSWRGLHCVKGTLGAVGGVCLLS